ncbi:MAG: 23S rRNA (guanosine(2251)-2'-O)-methyltransferase RlmB [Methylococcaceae bacterium TMED69]|nr:MAG: 23S rRNA (guanosine(2251)-2'-O)-methyltransferase RlmB [Methylococcaceae bacterium TMED69]
MGDSFVIGGSHACNHCLEYSPESCIEVWITEDSEKKIDSKISILFNTLGIPIHRVRRPTITKIYGSDSHNGILVRRKLPKFMDLNSFLDSVENLTNGLFLVLDRIQDPRNFGACLRVAECAGVTAVIFPNNNSAFFGSTLVKASSGAIDNIPLIRVSNVCRALNILKQQGVWIFGADGSATNSVYNSDLSRSMALVVGNEGFGLKRLTQKSCDELVSLPMSGSVSSLNVATATGIILFEANRQRI